MPIFDQKNGFDPASGVHQREGGNGFQGVTQMQGFQPPAPIELHLPHFTLLPTDGGGFQIRSGEKLILAHSMAAPALAAGFGDPKIDMYRGNFEMADRVSERAPLRYVSSSGDGATLSFASYPGDPRTVLIRLEELEENRLDLLFVDADPSFNRFWLRLPAGRDEAIWGCGEQMSYFNLRGRTYPLWTSEPGVGRDKNSEMTFRADVMGKAGGDYYCTNYPQPTFLSSRGYALHMATTAYADFNFSEPDAHELQVWAKPDSVSIYVDEDPKALVGRLSKRFGRQKPLPAWVDNGLIAGLKRGDHSFDLLDQIHQAGVPLAGIWCEDWTGLRETSFGSRLFWNWSWDKERYSNLPSQIAALKEKGIRFLGYVSPYLCTDGDLYSEGVAANAFAKSKTGDIYHVDFGEFDCAVIDLTNPKAAAWFRERVLDQNMLALGMSGWMADFGEYLPIDVALSDGSDPKLRHNAWPPLWGALNQRAMAENDMASEGLYFMRAGYTGTQATCPLLWAGDQCVDFSRHDGLVTAIVGALSSGLMGNAYHHSDIGGYTSLFGNQRTKELTERWAELAAFSSLMRSHEGNRPDDNFQIYQDPGTLAHLARMTKIFVALGPYRRALMAEAEATGLPLQRALMLHFFSDKRTFDVFDQFLLGPDLLVAPVWHEGAMERGLYLPRGANWAHVWSGDIYAGGVDLTIAAAIGQPPLFYRHGSDWSETFAKLASI